MARAARRHWTLEEFLALDDGTDRRYQPFDGQIVAMAPTSDIHRALVARLTRRIGGGLLPPCEIVIEAGIVPSERADSWYEADIAVTCVGRTGRQFIADPVASLQDILVVSSTKPRTEHYRREVDGWRVQDDAGGGIVALQSPAVAVDLGKLYAGVLTSGPAQAEGSAGS